MFQTKRTRADLERLRILPQIHLRCAMTRQFRAVLLTLGLTLAATTAAHAIDTAATAMPNRISMNVTVGKQTQGATFGEKVSSGLHAALVIECGTVACIAALPDGSGYRANLDTMTLAPLETAQGLSLRSATAVGSSSLGAALPGGSIISAAVSSVSSLAGGGGAAAASYARRSPDNGNIDIKQPLLDGDHALTLVVEKATSGLKDTLKTQVRMAAPQRIRIDMIFSVEAGRLKTRHDTAKNAISNVR
jgi:hypothetical protein